MQEAFQLIDWLNVKVQDKYCVNEDDVRQGEKGARGGEPKRYGQATETLGFLAETDRNVQPFFNNDGHETKEKSHGSQWKPAVTV